MPGLELAKQKKLSVITAESAGKASALLSEVAGAADHLYGGFIPYTKANKTEALGVPAPPPDDGTLVAIADSREAAIAGAASFQLQTLSLH